MSARTLNVSIPRVSVSTEGERRDERGGRLQNYERVCVCVFVHLYFVMSCLHMKSVLRCVCTVFAHACMRWVNVCTLIVNRSGKLLGQSCFAGEVAEITDKALLHTTHSSDIITSQPVSHTYMGIRIDILAFKDTYSMHSFSSN